MGSPLWQKIAGFHKNQAVNLQQILIHGQSGFSFLQRIVGVLAESRVATAFAASRQECKGAGFVTGFAAKFLQSAPFFFLQKRSAASKA